MSNTPELSANIIWLGQVSVRWAKLSQDADDIIRLACTYTKCEIIWDAPTQSHLAVFDREDGLKDYMPAESIGVHVEQSRGEIRQRMIDHIISEIGQEGYSQHGSRSSYAMGCRGLLCRRAHREGMRTQQGTKRSPKYAVADELLEEVEKVFEKHDASLAPYLADKVASL